MGEEQREFEKMCYEAYQLHWMISHGYALSDLFEIFTEITGSLIEDDPDMIPVKGEDIITLAEEVKDVFLNSQGFGSGSMYAGMDEFLNTEFLNPDYMFELIRMMPEKEKHWKHWKEIVKSTEG